MTLNDDILVTIVVVPRERFSLVDRCLASISTNTKCSYRLVCVVGGAPSHVEARLRTICAEHGYDLVVDPEHLSPNAARNLGLARATTRYVVFIDNDVIVAPDWLEALVGCAEETNGAIVGPLCMMGVPDDGIAHSAGGTLDFVPGDGRNGLVARHLWQDVDLTTRPLPPARQRRDFIEGHCLLVRRALFESIGAWDEELPALFDYIDVALHAERLGGSIWLEPTALISYLAFEDFAVGDLDYFVRRWSDDWIDRSVARFAETWSLSPETRIFTDSVDFARHHQGVCQRFRPSGRRAAAIDLDDHGFAQTNVQLLNQMRAVDYPTHDLQVVRAGYDAACMLFADRFQPSRNPFLSHLVGTASVLAAYGAPAPLVTAGLLHASYPRGGFPDETGQDHDAQRHWLRSRVGGLTEAIVHEYWRLDLAWIAHRVETDLDRLPLNVAYAIVLKIANLIEKQLDHQSSYYGSDEPYARIVAELADPWGMVYEKVATRLGARPMLSAVRDLAARVDRTVIEPELRTSDTSGFVVDPASRTSGPITRTVLPSRLFARPVANDSAFTVPRPLVLGPTMLSVELDAFSAVNGGDITRDRDTLLVSCDPQQWAYSAFCELGDPTFSGRGILRVTVAIEAGEVGVGVLVKGSSTAFAAPEHLQGPTDEPVELLFPIDDVEECGAVVLRSAAAHGVTRARLVAVSIHAPA